MPQTVLITGASSGFGRAAAQRFLDEGWNVVATMRTPDPAGFDAPPGRLLATALEVTSRPSIDAAFAATIATFGGVDAVVNNAGIGLLSAFEATPEATIQEVFATNTFGVMAVCQAAIPHLRARGGGTIVNVTSSAAIVPFPLVAVYTASKAAIEGFTESLAYELELVGLRARLVQPGLAPTTRFAANGATRMAGLTPAPYDGYAQAYFDRMAAYPTAYATEADVAEAVYAAATEPGDRLRFPGGADARMLAELRWGGREALAAAETRRMFVPDPTAAR